MRDINFPSEKNSRGGNKLHRSKFWTVRAVRSISSDIAEMHIQNVPPSYPRYWISWLVSVPSGRRNIHQLNGWPSLRWPSILVFTDGNPMTKECTSLLHKYTTWIKSEQLRYALARYFVHSQMITNLCPFEIACRLNTLQTVPWYLQNAEWYSNCCAYI